MNIENIKSIIESIKNYDYASLTADDIKYYLLDYKDITAVVILLLASVFMSYQSYNSSVAYEKDIAIQIEALEEKVSPSKKYEKSEKELAEFRATFPKFLTEREFINEITTFANTYNIDIRSLSSPQKKDEDFYHELSIQLDCQAQEYVDFAKFIQTIEQSPYAMRIDQMDVSFREAGSGRSGRQSNAALQDVQQLIISKITIVVIGLENEDAPKKEKNN